MLMRGSSGCTDAAIGICTSGLLSKSDSVFFLVNWYKLSACKWSCAIRFHNACSSGVRPWTVSKYFWRALEDTALQSLVTAPLASTTTGWDSCPLLPKKDAVRARLSTCYIFKELGNGVIDVYMKCFVELNGRIVDSVAIISAATGLLCCWKAVVCAQSKKLVWQLKTRFHENKRHIAGGMSSSVAASPSSQFQLKPSCGVCSKSFKVYSRVACCQLCGGAMCSRCRVTMKLAFPRPGEKDIRLKSVVVCKGCITSSSQQSTFEVAREEVLSGRFGLVYSCSAASESTRPSVASTESGDTIASNNAATVPAGTLLASFDYVSSSILLAQAQEYTQSSAPGTGATILHAHARDRKAAQGRKTSDGAAYLSSLSSATDTSKSSVTSEYNSHYSDTGGYDSADDVPVSEEDNSEIFAAAAVAATATSTECMRKYPTRSPFTGWSMMPTDSIRTRSRGNTTTFTPGGLPLTSHLSQEAIRLVQRWSVDLREHLSVDDLVLGVVCLEQHKASVGRRKAVHDVVERA